MQTQRVINEVQRRYKNALHSLEKPENFIENILMRGSVTNRQPTIPGSSSVHSGFPGGVGWHISLELRFAISDSFLINMLQSQILRTEILQSFEKPFNKFARKSIIIRIRKSKIWVYFILNTNSIQDSLSRILLRERFF